MTTTKSASSPTAYTKTDLNKGLATFTEDKRRIAKARTAFDTQVQEGVSQRKTIDLALRQAVIGLADEQSKLKQARKAARITPSQWTRARISEGTKKVNPTRRKATKIAKLKFKEQPAIQLPLGGIIGLSGGLIIALIALAMTTTWIYVSFNASQGYVTATGLTTLFIIAVVIFALTLGWSIGVGRLTTDPKVKSRKTTMKTTTT